MARLRLGVLGAGTVFSRCYEPALRLCRDYEIAGICDPRAAGPLVVADERALFDLGPDAVLIATPPELHAPQARAALEAGCHVLVEKPMALTAAEADSLVKAAEGRVLAVGFSRRFRRCYADLKRRSSVSAPQGANFHFRFDPTAWGATHESSVESDVFCHQVDLAAWLWNRPVAAVRLLERTSGRLRCELRMEGGGIVSVVAEHGPGYVERVRLRTERGTFAVAESGRAAWVRNAARRLLRRPGPLVQSTAALLESFANALRGAEIPVDLATAHDGAAAARATDAFLKSRNGGWIER